MYATLDFAAAIASAIQDKLDVGTAYPVVYTMTPQTVELFVGSVCEKLHRRILNAMNDGGEQFVEQNDSLGLALHLMRNEVKLPPDMLMDICAVIIEKSRNYSKWICPLRNQQGDLWYRKLYIDLGKDETP